MEFTFIYADAAVPLLRHLDCCRCSSTLFVQAPCYLLHHCPQQQAAGIAAAPFMPPTAEACMQTFRVLLLMLKQRALSYHRYE